MRIEAVPGRIKARGKRASDGKQIKFLFSLVTSFRFVEDEGP